MTIEEFLTAICIEKQKCASNEHVTWICCQQNVSLVKYFKSPLKEDKMSNP